jgi:ribonuclease HII
MKRFEEMSVTEVKRWLDMQTELSERTIRTLRQDSRAGVRALAEIYLKKRARQQAEAERMEHLWHYEQMLSEQGFQRIAGIDEAGRGPLAGPVVAGAVVLSLDRPISGLNDSKQLSAAQRERLFHEIRENAVAFGIGIVDVDYIDTYNILQATYEAMRRAIRALHQEPDHLINDAVLIPDIEIPQLNIIKGDAKSQSIAAASILAKVTRDQLMMEYGKLFPEYGFERHMGYSTPDHLSAMRANGVSPIHRKSFAPVAEALILK